MKTTKLLLILIALGLTFTSCKKETCTTCHYDGPNGEVELGEKCNEEIEDLERNGYVVNGQTYTVHCGEDH